MIWMDYILAIVTPILGAGWIFTYRAYKRKANGEAVVAEADGWKAQQDVYQQTIADLEHSCDFIRKDRDLLRKENEELRDKNKVLQEKINTLENKIDTLSYEIEQNKKRIEMIEKYK